MSFVKICLVLTNKHKKNLKIFPWSSISIKGKNLYHLALQIQGHYKKSCSETSEQFQKFETITNKIFTFSFSKLNNQI